MGCPNYSPHSYTDNEDGTVTDNVTGLMWAADGSGDGCASGGELDWSSAISWAEGISFAGYSDWHMPDVRQLTGIMEIWRANPYAYTIPLVNPTYFPNTKADVYWTNFDGSTIPDTAFFIGFDMGDLAPAPKNMPTYVRGVRNP